MAEQKTQHHCFKTQLCMSCEMTLGQSASLYSVTNLTTTTLEDSSLMDIWRGLEEWEPLETGEYQDRMWHSESTLIQIHI